MKNGGWIPLCKSLASELPLVRPFTKLEAMFSLTLDYDQGKPVTIKGYSGLWQWSQGKVKRFLEEIGASIEYPENTGQKQNQRGEIAIQITERKRRDNGEIKFIDSRCLDSRPERKQREAGEITERSQVTTIDPNPKLIKTLSEFFGKLWKAYPNKDGRKAAEKHYYATVKNASDMERIDFALGNYLNHIEANKIDPKFIKNGSTWFNNWQDWEVTEDGQ